MKFILGVVAGAIGYWFYQSRTAKPLSAPEFLEHARQSVNSAARAGAQRTVEAIDRAPLPQQVKDVAGQVTSTVHAQSAEPATFSGASASARAQTPEGDLRPEAAAP